MEDITSILDKAFKNDVKSINTIDENIINNKLIDTITNYCINSNNGIAQYFMCAIYSNNEDYQKEFEYATKSADQNNSYGQVHSGFQ